MTRRATALVLAGLVFLALAPYYLDQVPLRTLGQILVFGLLAASLDLLVGITGLPSLGHAAYYAVGGYTAGLLAQEVTTNGPVQVAAAGAAALLAAAASGWLAVRRRGIYFLVLTVAIGQIVATLATTWDDLTGGSDGLHGIPDVTLTPGAAPLTQAAERYWYTFGGFAIGFAVLWCIASSPFGRVLRGIRDNEQRMRAIGYAVFWYKYAAFCIAGAVAGAAGALFVAHEGRISPANAGFETSVFAVLAVVIGGTGSLWGPCVGAGVVLVVRDTIGVRLDGQGPLLLGLVFIAVVYLLPRGVAAVRLPAARRS